VVLDTTENDFEIAGVGCPTFTVNSKYQVDDANIIIFLHIVGGRTVCTVII